MVTNEEILKSIANLIYKSSGISFPENHLNVLDQRVQSRIKEEGITAQDLYSQLLLDKETLFEFIGFVTTNHTLFFRSINQFTTLETVILPELIKKNNHVKHIAVWSCACSTGEEPYTIAIYLQHYFDKNGLDDWSYSIIATDIDRSSLNKAIEGIYPRKNKDDIPVKFHEYLIEGVAQPDFEDSHYISVRPDIKQHVRFNIYNLMDTPPYRNQDIIFCRNVLIYSGFLAED